MMMMQSRKIWYYRITLIILLFAMLLAWALLPGVHEFINRSVAAFAAVDQQGIERFIQSYGALAAVVSFLLMILQAIAAPLPAFFDHLCQCVAVWRVLGRLAVVDQFDGRRGAVLFYRQSDGPRSGGKINRQNRA
ncbi:inner membrane protein [Escherichia coli]|nr:inner membrane protein [Escherichia coli]